MRGRGHGMVLFCTILYFIVFSQLGPSALARGARAARCAARTPWGWAWMKMQQTVSRVASVKRCVHVTM